eukprot:Skav214528  [mRNA]  locus=scaffold410:255548:256269:- [translate_table: standard]
MAKSVVSSGLSARCLVQLSYAIGVAKPLSLFVETYGSEKTGLDVNDITNVLKILGCFWNIHDISMKMEFDCRPGAIAQSLALREPKYQETAAYCHFGREPVTKKLALRRGECCRELGSVVGSRERVWTVIDQSTLRLITIPRMKSRVLMSCSPTAHQKFI